MFVRAIDVETLGLEPGAGVCEIGFCDVHQRDGKWVVDPVPISILVNPGKPIPPLMSAIHHIIDADVADAPMLDDAISGADLLQPDVVFCAHKASFEQDHLPQIKGAKIICTWKVAIKYKPKAPGHKLQELRYWNRLELDRDLASPPHRAGPDAYVNAHLVARMLDKLTIEEMVETTAQPAILPYLNFGQWAMRSIEDIDSGYLSWIVNSKPKPGQDPFDPDVIATALHHLNLRRAKT